MELTDRGRALVAGARALQGTRGAAAAWDLYRTAIPILAHAALVQSGAELDPPEDLAQALFKVDSLASDDWNVQAAVDRLRAEGPEPGADEVPRRDLDQTILDASIVADFLFGRVEPRSPSSIRQGRWLRLVLLGASLVASVAVSVVVVRMPKNVARDKAVTASSRYPRSPHPSAAVDGQKNGRFGVHTLREQDPWVLIDLGQRYQLEEVVVSNRGDGYHRDVVPLVLEVSDDGDNFEKVAVRKKSFTEKDPWRQSLEGRSTRFLRLRGRSGRYVALSEVEAYGYPE